MRRAAQVAAGTALLVALAAGCGGGGDKTLSSGDYRAQLNRVCSDLNVEQKRIGTPTGPVELAAKGPQLLDAFDNALAKVKKLRPPDELEAQARKFVSLAEQERDLISDAVDAAKANDLAKLQQAGMQALTLDKEGDTVAKRLGAPACATTGS
jgi:molybdenum-dependent DNA-binding transcriptional regulator ModE